VFAQVAAADTLSIAQYRARLAEVRSLLERSRSAPAAERDRMRAQATTLLRETSAIVVRDETVAIDDGPIVEVLGAADGTNRAIALIDLEIAFADRASASRLDPSAVDARLHEAVGSNEAAGGVSAALTALIDYVLSRVGAFLTGIGGSVPELRSLPYAIALFGLAFVVFIVATLGRGTRERIRREVLVSAAGPRPTDEPAAHLRRAEDALARGRARDAIHELYLYVIASLTTRELIRYDAALTDRELLSRAAAIPNADALVDLVALYERAWFGLREPDADEARRAQTLARRIAG
jgi:hypothetical protein